MLKLNMWVEGWNIVRKKDNSKKLAGASMYWRWDQNEGRKKNWVREIMYALLGREEKEWKW